MALTLPTVPPGSVVAGDSIAFTRAFQDYPASAGWELAYTLISKTAVKNFTATADGDGFDVNVPAADTAAWAPDTYRLVEVLTNIGTGARVTLNTTTLIVTPNLAAAQAGVDTRTHAEKMLAAIDAWLEAKAPTSANVEINGRKIQYYPLTDLLAMRDKYARIVAREQAADGTVSGVRILVRL